MTKRGPRHARKRGAPRAPFTPSFPATPTQAVRPAFALGALLLLGATLLLYWGASRHPLVFDDLHLNESTLRTRFAQVAAWFGQRWISDASFGWVYALFGKDMVAQRLVNVLLHAATGIALFGFLSRL